MPYVFANAGRTPSWLILGRELYKGIEDVGGDSRYGIRTIASSLGVGAAVLWGTVVLYVLVTISPLPAIIGYCSNTVAYSAFAFLGVDVLVLVASVMMLSNPARNAWRATRILELPLLVRPTDLHRGVLAVSRWDDVVREVRRTSIHIIPGVIGNPRSCLGRVSLSAHSSVLLHPILTP